jgi:nucleotidyltransferase substrate binding protein (TIGR01987 family)
VSEINYNKFKESLARLQERYNDYLAAQSRTELLPSDKESIQESCIQRFEICLDTSWKHLKKYLIEEMGLVDIPSSPNPIFRKAAASLVISDAELWIEFNKKRGDTSHDYCGDKAGGTFEIIPDFIKEAISLYETISGVKWRN